MRPTNKISRHTRYFIFAVLVLFVPTISRAQGTAADYQRAQSLREKFQGLAVNVPGNPTWIEGDNHFWYRKSVPGGYEFIIVDAESLTKKPAFDHEKLAAALSTASGTKYTAVTLPFAEPAAAGGRGGFGAGSLTFIDFGSSITFAAAGYMWNCNLTSYQCTKGSVFPQFPAGRGGRGPVDDTLSPEQNPFVSPEMQDEIIQDGIEVQSPQEIRNN